MPFILGIEEEEGTQQWEHQVRDPHSDYLHCKRMTYSTASIEAVASPDPDIQEGVVQLGAQTLTYEEESTFKIASHE